MKSSSTCNVSMSYVHAIGLGCLLCRALLAEGPNQEVDATRIPLDKIWAWKMPNTRDIGELETDKPPNYAYGRLVREIRRAIGTFPEEGKAAGEAFAVLSTGLDALREAHAVLVRDKKPRESFPAGSKVSAVFFSRSFGSYVHLHEVNRRDDVIEFRYRFVPHKTRELTEHIAIVPLGELPPGEYQIAVVQLPMEQRFTDAGIKPIDPKVAKQIVSSSSSFSVRRN